MAVTWVAAAQKTKTRRIVWAIWKSVQINAHFKDGAQTADVMATTQAAAFTQTAAYQKTAQSWILTPARNNPDAAFGMEN